MAELGPGSRVAIINPNVAVGISRPGIVQSYALLRGPAGEADDPSMAAVLSDTASQSRTQLDDSYPARENPTQHAPAFGLYFPEAEGAVRDGSTNDAAAIQAAIDAMPGDISSGGGTLVLSAGSYVIATQVNITRPGVRIESPGGFAAQIYCAPTLTGAAFKFAIPNTFIRGCQVRNVSLRMNGSSAHGFVFEGAYDQTILENVIVFDNKGTSSAFRFVPAAGAPSAISQTIIANNCAAWAKVGEHTGNVWHMQKVQEATLLGCKGLSGAEGAGGGYSFYLEDCRGVSLYNASAGRCNVAFRVNTVSYASDGVNINNPTVEGAAHTLIATGGAGRQVIRLALSGLRPQVGTSLSTGPFTLEHVILSTIETKDFVANLDANSSSNHVISEDLTKVTDNGANNAVMAWRNANRLTTFHGGLAVSATSGPAFRHYASGRSGHYESLWSASSSVDNGFFFRYSPDGSTNRSVWFVEPDQIKQHWYVFDGTNVVESMRLERLPAASKSGFWLVVNNGTTTTLKQVEVGAADSAGAGFRQLRVAN